MTEVLPQRTSLVVSSFPKRTFLSLCATVGPKQQLRCFAGRLRKCPSPFLTMFTGWLRICFGSGRQQQTVTITTPGITDVQFASTPPHDYQHSYATFLSSSHHGSLFCRYFPQCAQPWSVAPPCTNLRIGQVSLTIQGNTQCRCRLGTRASTRRATVVAESLARNRTNSVVRRFSSPRHLTPRQKSC